MTGADEDIASLVERVAALLMARNVRLATAESCTGGWLAKSLTDLPGSSAWFEFGFVAYGNNAKETLLAVDPLSIERYGAVSREVAIQMAVTARAVSEADIAVAVTGIAGPDGGTPEKPVGTVWLAWDGPDRRASTRLEHYVGDRRAVRRQAVLAALMGLLRQLADG